MWVPLGRAVRSVLVVDDDALFRRAVGRTLARSRAVFLAGTMREALTLAGREQLDLAVIDLVLRGESGVQLLEALASEQPTTIAVIVSGLLSAEATRRAFRAGAYDCFEKPIDWPTLFRSVEHGDALVHPPDEIPTIRQLERDLYRRLVEAHGGNITKTAARCGIDRRTLQRNLRRETD